MTPAPDVRADAMRWREAAGVRWLEARVGAARAAFSTRLGGASDGPFTSLNLGADTGDRPEPVAENRRRLASALGIRREDALIGRQVHGAAVLARDAAPVPNPFAAHGPAAPAADAQATAVPGLVPAVLVADCLPVALAGPDGVVMAHCGWRGLAAGIVERAAGTVRAEAAAIGPGIGSCCYEVGEEVLSAFAGLGGGIAAGRMLDLREITRRLLGAAGVGAVDTCELCTSCNPDLFFSHRRDRGRTGRQAGLAWLEERA